MAEDNVLDYPTANIDSLTGFPSDTKPWEVFDRGYIAKESVENIATIADIMREVGYDGVGISIQAGLMNDPKTVAEAFVAAGYPITSGDVPYVPDLSMRLYPADGYHGLTHLIGHILYSNLATSPTQRHRENTLKTYKEVISPREGRLILRVDSEQMVRDLYPILLAVKRAGIANDVLFAIEINAGMHDITEYIGLIDRLLTDGINSAVSFDGAHSAISLVQRGRTSYEGAAEEAFEKIREGGVPVAMIEVNPMNYAGMPRSKLDENIIDYGEILKQLPQTPFLYEGDPRRSGRNTVLANREMYVNFFNSLRVN